MRCHASPASRPRILSVTARMGRLSRHYSSSSPATLPHAGALRHEPVMRRIAPEHRTTHGVAAPVTNFRLREISDRGRPRSRPPEAATAPGRRRRSAVGTPSPEHRRAFAAPPPAPTPANAPTTTACAPATISRDPARVARAQQGDTRLCASRHRGKAIPSVHGIRDDDRLAKTQDSSPTADGKVHREATAGRTTVATSTAPPRPCNPAAETRISASLLVLPIGKAVHRERIRIPKP